jgi:hypothetical protein
MLNPLQESLHMSHRRTILSLIFIYLSLSVFLVQNFAQNEAPVTVEYNGLELSVAKAEMVDWDPANSYILVILRIKNNSNKTVRYIAKYRGELSLVDDLGKSYYGIYAQEVPEAGLKIFSGEQQRIGYAFQKPDLNCSSFTMSFSKSDLQGLEQAKGNSQEGGSIKIPIPVKDILVLPKAKERHENDFKKELNIDGMIFIVNEAFIWRRPVRNDIILSSPPPASPALLGITFDFINKLMTTRVDIAGNFSYSLVDDLGNKYKSMRPTGYFNQMKVVPEHFPRIYPGELYQETIFFEPPSDTIKYLLFTINATSVGIKKEISVKIPAQEIAK